MRYVPRHTAVSHVNMTGIGVSCDKSIVEGSREIDIRAPYDRYSCFHG